MKCTEAKRLFSPMLDSMLDNNQGRALDEHMAGCENCTA
jgi:hypothetical protein